MEDITIITLALLQNLNVHKASGPDTISTRLLKETAEVTAPILKLIFERSLATGEVPYDWRIANITPVYQKRRTLCSTKLPTDFTNIHLLQSNGTYYFFSFNETSRK